MKGVLHEQTRLREQTGDGGTHQINTEEVTFKPKRTKEGRGYQNLLQLQESHLRAAMAFGRRMKLLRPSPWQRVTWGNEYKGSLSFCSSVFCASLLTNPRKSCRASVQLWQLLGCRVGWRADKGEQKETIQNSLPLLPQNILSCLVEMKSQYSQHRELNSPVSYCGGWQQPTACLCK